MKDRMEQQRLAGRVDRVLRGLGEAEPDEGFEQQVLAAARERAGKCRSGRASRLWLLELSRFWSATAAACVLAVALWAGYTHRPRQPEAALIERILPVSSTASAAPSAQSARAAGSSSPGGAEARLPRLTRVSRPARETSRATTALLVNRPAPEAPLTDEEQLLRQIARGGRPEELRALNPDARDAVAEAEKLEFHKFFGPPPTGDRE